MAKFYFVSQSNHGHEDRWIFKADEFRKALDEDGLAHIDLETDSGSDIGFPIGGSNSSATWWEPVETEEEAIAYLKSPASGPDLEDPELVDIAEYLCTVNAYDVDSYTDELLEKFGLNANDLTQYDDEYHSYSNVEKMVAGLKAAGYEDFDYEDPFYGENRDMRYNDLVELYNEVCGGDMEEFWR